MLRLLFRNGIRVLTCVLAGLVVAPAQEATSAPVQQTKPPQEAAGPRPPVLTNTGLFGSPVKSVAFKGIVPAEESRFAKYVEQSVGEPLDRTKIQRSIRALYGTGMFGYVGAEGLRVEGGVALTFVVSKNLFVGAIEVDGLPKRGPNPAQIVNASNLDLGQPYTPEKVNASFSSIKKVMADNGFYRATVTATETAVPDRQQMNITYHLKPGHQARVGRIIVQGSSTLKSGDVQDIAK
ncbi:MAG TPA: POTRA domain-containing protein, partial [Terriglobales bacterium]